MYNAKEDAGNGVNVNFGCTPCLGSKWIIFPQKIYKHNHFDIHYAFNVSEYDLVIMHNVLYMNYHALCIISLAFPVKMCFVHSVYFSLFKHFKILYNIYPKYKYMHL